MFPGVVREALEIITNNLNILVIFLFYLFIPKAVNPHQKSHLKWGILSLRKGISFWQKTNALASYLSNYIFWV